MGFFNSEYLTPPYVIAEIGVNHEGSMDLAKRLISEAKSGGASAVKFQTYKAELLASKDSPAYWDQTLEPTANQFQLFKKYDAFGRKEYEQLADYCVQLGIDFASTPFDTEAVSWLNDLVPFFKIASADITNIPLLKAVARTEKPVVLSTGASSIDEIVKAKNVLEDHGCTDLTLLHCILSYPTVPSAAHLLMITDIKSHFPTHVIGYSDHTVPTDDMLAPLLAWTMGATVIEKHFTHDKTLPGNDHYHAMDANDLKYFQSVIQRSLTLAGDLQTKAPVEAEMESRAQARRSLVLTRELPSGAVLREEDLVCKRPGTGISPLELEIVVGKKLKVAKSEDSILKWCDLI